MRRNPDLGARVQRDPPVPAEAELSWRELRQNARGWVGIEKTVLLALKWLWVKNMHPKWNPGKWKYEPKPGPLEFTFDPFPNLYLRAPGGWSPMGAERQ